jgi:hypothetical protein
LDIAFPFDFVACIAFDYSTTIINTSK